MANTELPLIDPQALKRLADDTSEELVPQMLQMFVSELETRLLQLPALAEGGEAEALRECAHSIKGLCGTFGAARLEAVAKRLEDHAREGRIDEATALAPALQPLGADTLRAYRAGSAP